MNAWASVRLSRECGLGLVSGSRQHMPDTALWGPAFIPRCFHSPTFGRCTKKVFSQVFAFQQKKKKKSASIYFCTHLDYCLSFDTQHFSIMQQSRKNMHHFFLCTKLFWEHMTSKQTAFPNHLSGQSTFIFVISTAENSCVNMIFSLAQGPYASVSTVNRSRKYQGL